MTFNTATLSRLRKSGLRRSITGAASIVSVGAALKTAQGAIVYSGLQNLSITATLDADGFQPVTLSSLSNKGADFSLHSYSTKDGDIYHDLVATTRFDHFTPIVISTPGPNLDILRRLDKGDVVDSQRDFVDIDLDRVEIRNYYEPNTQWTGGTEGYFGYRFDVLPGPRPLYGWGHFSLSADANVLTLVDWAYEDTGAPILAGHIPEPVSALLLSAGLAVAAFWRRYAKKIHA